VRTEAAKICAALLGLVVCAAAQDLAPCILGAKPPVLLLFGCCAGIPAAIGAGLFADALGGLPFGCSAFFYAVAALAVRFLPRSLAIITAILFAAAALFTALWGGRLIGRLVDRWGYRNVMIWDTVVLFFVCLLYGFAKDWFPLRVAVAVVCVNYVLDAVLSNASMATNLYARTLSDSQEELTANISPPVSP
jgi:predicted MFS family arabinose efflux permease